MSVTVDLARQIAGIVQLHDRHTLSRPETRPTTLDDRLLLSLQHQGGADADDGRDDAEHDEELKHSILSLKLL
ncbi:MAG TPA: hypothetical protein VJK50_02185 [Patescibacteria group bacterium]|nr:hypothetical protein [Patescibacteria group bacterium]